MSARALPDAARRGWCPGLARPMPTGDGLLARIHPPLGVLTLAQAATVAEGARRFGNGHLDLTARANLQIRGVSEATREPLAYLLDAAGLGDSRSDGGPQRLTLTLPLAGCDPGEAMDMAALADAIEQAGRGIAGLPPKTLVAVGFSMAEADLSVTAPGPERVAILIATAEGLLPVGECGRDEAPAWIATMLKAFARSGKRRMRELSARERSALPPPSAARTSTHQYEQARRAPSPVRERVGVRAETSPERSHPSPCSSPSGREDPRPVRDVESSSPRRSVPPPGLSEPAPGLVVLALAAPFGRCTADALDRLIAVAEETGARDIRLSPSRGFVLLPRDPERAAARLAGLSADFITVSDDPRRAVHACTGAPACASGTTPTLADAGRLAAAFAPFAARGLHAHVSGCAKGCAHPGRAALTLVGRDGRYAIVLDGASGDPPAALLPIEAALERLGKAETIGLAAAFAPEAADTGRDRRPA